MFCCEYYFLIVELVRVSFHKSSKRISSFLIVCSSIRCLQLFILIARIRSNFQQQPINKSNCKTQNFVKIIKIYSIINNHVPYLLIMSTECCQMQHCIAVLIGIVNQFRYVIRIYESIVGHSDIFLVLFFFALLNFG